MSEKNVLILCMSTLNRITENYYQTEDDKMFFRGISQLEAGTKYFMRKLQNDGRKIDRIYIIESTATREPVNEDLMNLIKEDKTILNSFDKIENQSTFGESDSIAFELDEKSPQEASIKQEGSVSAVEFYKKRIIQYILGREKQVEQRISGVPGKYESEFQKLREGINNFENNTEPLGVLYTEDVEGGETFDNLSSLFVDIKMEDEEQNDAVYTSIYELCSKIRGEKETPNSDTTVNLFLDIQGARRYETFIVNSAVKMLEMSHINVESTVAVDFSPRTNTGSVKENDRDPKGDVPPRYNRIVDATLNNYIYELVSGMNEFIRTGRGDTLREFWEHVQGEDLQATQKPASSWDTLKALYEPKKVQGLSLNPEEQEIIRTIGKISDSISLCDVSGFGDSLSDLGKTLKKYDKSQEKNKLFLCCVQNLREDYERYNLLSQNPTCIDQIDWCVSKKLYQQALTLLEAKLPDDLVANEVIYYGTEEQLRDMLNYCMLKKKFNVPPYYVDVDGEEKKKIKKDAENYVFIKCWLGGGGIDINNGSICELLNSYNEFRKIRNITNHANGKAQEEGGLTVEALDEKLTAFIGSYRKILENHDTINCYDLYSPSEDEKNEKNEMLKETFKSLPMPNEDELQKSLEEKWSEDEEIISAFNAINNAVNQMEGLSYEKFLKGKDSTYSVLRNVFNLIHRNILQVHKDENISIEKFYKNRFDKGEKSFDKFCNLIKMNWLGDHEILGFDPKDFCSP